MNTLSTRGRGKQKIVKTTRRKALSARRKRKIDDDKGTTTTRETKKKQGVPRAGARGVELPCTNVCVYSHTYDTTPHTHTHF